TDMPLMNQYIAVDQPKQTMRTVQIDGKHYFLLGGDDHPAGFIEHTEVYYEQLYEALKKDFLLTSLITGWSAQDPETPDIIPYAGQITKQLPHVYISTGNGKWGLSTALVGARVITDQIDRKSTRLNSSHVSISYAVFCLKKKKTKQKHKVAKK